MGVDKSQIVVDVDIAAVAATPIMAGAKPSGALETAGVVGLVEGGSAVRSSEHPAIRMTAHTRRARRFTPYRHRDGELVPLLAFDADPFVQRRRGRRTRAGR
jgi:hypothetical protein